MSDPRLRLSRPCYDKMHRCPGWAGGGTRFARVSRCDDGHVRPLRAGGSVESIYQGAFWRLRVNRCDTCGVFTLPYAIRYLDWRHWRSELRSGWLELCFQLRVLRDEFRRNR